MQTSDARKYFPMLLLTSQTIARFCSHDEGRVYSSFVGLKRGKYAWQATMNRIYMLHELLSLEAEGWVCYLDADAWIHDLGFAIEDYLSSKSDAAAIMIQSGATENWWDVNAGVFFINLENKMGRLLVKRWFEHSESVWPVIANNPDWPINGPTDQSILHRILKEEFSPEHIYLESRKLINSGTASFIRQKLRSEAVDFDQRLSAISAEIASVCDIYVGNSPPMDTRDILDAVYRACLNREMEDDLNNHHLRSLSADLSARSLGMIISRILQSDEFQVKWRDERKEVGG